MIKAWTVFSLDEAVGGISNNGIYYDECTFTLGRYYKGVFDSEACAISYIEETMKDLESRGVGEKTRFVVMQVFCYKNDKIFSTNI